MKYQAIFKNVHFWGQKKGKMIPETQHTVNFNIAVKGRNMKEELILRSHQTASNIPDINSILFSEQIN